MRFESLGLKIDQKRLFQYIITISKSHIIQIILFKSANQPTNTSELQLKYMIFRTTIKKID